MPLSVKIWISIEFPKKLMGSWTLLSKLMGSAEPIESMLTRPLVFWCIFAWMQPTLQKLPINDPKCTTLFMHNYLKCNHPGLVMAFYHGTSTLLKSFVKVEILGPTFILIFGSVFGFRQHYLQFPFRKETSR